MAFLNFNATNHKPSDPNSTGFEPLEPGWYKMVMTESDIKSNKNGNGTHLAITLEGVDGAGKGRKVWDRIHVTHQNNQCVKIGERILGDICVAVGVLEPGDSKELHNKPMGVHLEIKEWEYQGKQRRGNNVKGYCAVSKIPDVPQSTTEATIPPPPTGADPYKS